MYRILIGLTGLLLTTTAFADITDPLRFSGFGTLGVALNHDEGADYTTTYEQAEGVGRSQSVDYLLDTVLGVQADAHLATGLSATAQMLSRRVADGSSRPYFEWANLKYLIADDTSVRLGRVVAPMFMVSESRAIGYAQTSARLPGEVYLLNPITYVDGGGVTHQFEIGNTLFAANATAGKLEQELPTMFGDIVIDYDTAMINFVAEHNASQFRIGYAKAVLDFANANLDMLSIALDVLISAEIVGARKLQAISTYQDFDVDFYDLGYLYDNGNWQWQAEFVARRADSYIATDNDAFFILGAYRLQNWTPYLRYARSNSLNDRSQIPTLDASTTENPLLIYIVDNVNEFAADLGVFDERTSWTVGTRWDVADNYALKLQCDRISKPAGNSGFFANFTDDFGEHRQRVNVYSATLDFVF